MTPMGQPAGLSSLVDYRKLFESLSAPYVVLLPDPPTFTVMAASDAFLRATRKQREDIVGHGVFDIFPDNPLACRVRHAQASFERLLTSRAPDPMPVQRHDVPIGQDASGDFEARWWSPLSTPVFAPDGSVACIVLRMDDVTDFMRHKHLDANQGQLSAYWHERMQRTEAETCLRAQQLLEVNTSLRLAYAEAERLREKTQEIFDQASDAIFVTGVDGRFCEVNDACSKLLGHSREALLGMSCFDLAAPSDEGKLHEMHARLRDGAVHIEEWLLRHEDGHYMPLEVRARNLSDGRRVAFARDIGAHKLAQTIKRMAAIELIQRVAKRTDDLRRLGADLEMAEDRERRRIARDLHDDIGQSLAAARLWLSALCTSDQEDVRKAACKADGLLDQANQATRSLAAQIAPTILYELGLLPALEWLAQDIEHVFGLQVTVIDDGQPKPLTPDVRSILYRATRELLINAAKHAHADSAIVTTQCQGRRIIVRVTDEGLGFDMVELATTTRRGLGLLSVRERLAFIGGTFDLSSTPGEGTRAELSAPLEKAGTTGPHEQGALQPIHQAEMEMGVQAGHAAAQLQSLIDALAGNVAVLDGQGDIRLVNQAWQDFAQANGAPGMRQCGPGVNYLAAWCNPDLDVHTKDIQQGLIDVLQGRQTEFVSMYPCELPDGQRWFMLHAAPMVGDHYMVTHIDLTCWVDHARLNATRQANGGVHGAVGGRRAAKRRAD
jgi:PAS domain S-box-containing protein